MAAATGIEEQGTPSGWEPPWAPTPTGLPRDCLADLTDDETRLLAAWHYGKSGDDDGRPWWPAAIRRMPLEERLRLASNHYEDAAWERRERLEVERSHIYFVLSYGSLQDEEGSAPDPFLAWPEQVNVLRELHEYLRILILKARQLGLTWVALHYGVWLMGFNPETPRARILALSKQGEDAAKLVKRSRKIMALLPPYLHISEAQETRRSNSQFKLVGRGSMESLPGTPEAARSETATLVILDEAAFYRNQNFSPTWTAVQPTVGRRGKAIVISTGNGPEEAPGDGQAFARLWNRARSGDVGAQGMRTIFLPSRTDPRRTPQWRVDAEAQYLEKEEFEAEYPETEEQALAGISGIKVYLPSGINMAERIGAEFDGLLAVGRMSPPWGGALVVANDWGESTHMLGLWPLEQGGFYVFCEYAPDQGPNVEPGQSTRAFLRIAREAQRMRESLGEMAPWPQFGVISYDSAGVQSQKTMKVTVESDPVLLTQFAPVKGVRGRQVVRHQPVPFKDYKEETKGYLRYLFRRTSKGLPTGIIAISPTCRVLLRQLRGLELEDDGSGKIKKGDDHGPDALIAGTAGQAARSRNREEPAEMLELAT
jgi:hypothetical protein